MGGDGSARRKKAAAASRCHMVTVMIGFHLTLVRLERTWSVENSSRHAPARVGNLRPVRGKARKEGRKRAPGLVKMGQVNESRHAYGE